jgi:hypothetical protein
MSNAMREAGRASPEKARPVTIAMQKTRRATAGMRGSVLLLAQALSIGSGTPVDRW